MILIDNWNEPFTLVNPSTLPMFVFFTNQTGGKGWDHGFKNRTGHQTVFFLISGSIPVFARFLIGCWPVLGVLTGPDWLPVPGWTGRTDRSGPVFKTVDGILMERATYKFFILELTIGIVRIYVNQC